MAYSIRELDAFCRSSERCVVCRRGSVVGFLRNTAPFPLRRSVCKSSEFQAPLRDFSIRNDGLKKRGE